MIATVGDGVLPNLRSLTARLSVVAIASRTLDRTTAVATRFGIPAVDADLTTMLAEADLDAVVNLILIPAHVETSMEIIDAGVHLVTEKPLALTMDEADAICDAAARRAS